MTSFVGADPEESGELGLVDLHHGSERQVVDNDESIRCLVVGEPVADPGPHRGERRRFGRGRERDERDTDLADDRCRQGDDRGTLDRGKARSRRAVAAALTGGGAGAPNSLNCVWRIGASSPAAMPSPTGVSYTGAVPAAAATLAKSSAGVRRYQNRPVQ